MSLSHARILKLFRKMNDELSRQNIMGEVLVVGGAAMCLAFKARPSTRDVDAIFEPSSKVRKIAEKIAKSEGVPLDWLNDGVKGFLNPKIQKSVFLELSNLRIYIATAESMLAMKSISARFDTADRDDIVFLIHYLKLKSSKQVFRIIENFYPKKNIPVKTQYLIEELFED